MTPAAGSRQRRYAENDLTSRAAHIRVMTKNAPTRRENAAQGSYRIEAERQRGRTERERIRQSEKTKRQRLRSTAAIWRWSVAGVVTCSMALGGPTVASYLLPAPQSSSSTITTSTNH